MILKKTASAEVDLQVFQPQLDISACNSLVVDLGNFAEQYSTRADIVNALKDGLADVIAAFSGTSIAPSTQNQIISNYMKTVVVPKVKLLETYMGDDKDRRADGKDLYENGMKLVERLRELELSTTVTLREKDVERDIKLAEIDQEKAVKLAELGNDLKVKHLEFEQKGKEQEGELKKIELENSRKSEEEKQASIDGFNDKVQEQLDLQYEKYEETMGRIEEAQSLLTQKHGYKFDNSGFEGPQMDWNENGYAFIVPAKYPSTMDRSTVREVSEGLSSFIANIATSALGIFKALGPMLAAA